MNFDPPINPPTELEPPGPLPPGRRFLKEREALGLSPDGQVLVVALVCLAVGVVGLALLFTGWLS